MELVPPERLGAVWAEVAPWIEAAVKRGQGDENPTDVLVAIARGSYLLFHEPGRFAVVGQIQRHPQQTIGQILYCGGTGLEDIKTAFDNAKHWCRANGITALRTFGRRGWGRLLGLKEVGVILQGEL